MLGDPDSTSLKPLSSLHICHLVLLKNCWSWSFFFFFLLPGEDILKIYCSKMLFSACSPNFFHNGISVNLSIPLKPRACLSLLWVIQLIRTLGGYKDVLHGLSVYPFDSWRLGKDVEKKVISSDALLSFAHLRKNSVLLRQIKCLDADLCADQ